MFWLLGLLWLLLCNAVNAQLATTTSFVFKTSTVCPCTSPPTQTFSPQPTSTTSLPLSSSTPFPIRIDTGSSLQKRAFFYVAFDDDTAIGVQTLNEAALFSIVNSYLLNNGMYVGANTSQGYQTMRRYLDFSSVTPGWSLDQDSAVSLDGQAFSLGGGTAQFCVSAQGAVILEITESAPACDGADLAALLSKSTY